MINICAGLQTMLTLVGDLMQGLGAGYELVCSEGDAQGVFVTLRHNGREGRVYVTKSSFQYDIVKRIKQAMCLKGHDEVLATLYDDKGQAIKSLYYCCTDGGNAYKAADMTAKLLESQGKGQTVRIVLDIALPTEPAELSSRFDKNISPTARPLGRAHCDKPGTSCAYRQDQTCVNCGRRRGWRQTKETK